MDPKGFEASEAPKSIYSMSNNSEYVCKLYKDGDWKVSISTRSNGQKDWFYNHREYNRTFRSKPEVELFMETTLLNGIDIFRGRKLQKKLQFLPFAC
uniref:MBD domain-containing protein n=1 Tax=Leersia perrieri TaxID=77586 RepID=A0A0D9W433_9ORYZ